MALVGSLAASDIETLSTPELALTRLQSGQGGTIRLDFDGVLNLSESLFVSTNLTVDATGRNVSLDGGGKVRHFVVTNGAHLQLVNLTFANGRALAAPAGTGQPGAVGRGGSIENSGGIVELTGCVFLKNQATGSDGGAADPTVPSGLQPGARGGPAYGGAIYSESGQLRLTNCTFISNTAVGGLGALSPGGYTGGGGDSFGGAIYSTNGHSALSAVVFTNNIAQAGEMSGGRAFEGGGGGYGGAFASDADLGEFTDCSFLGNQALGGTKVDSDASRETGIAKGGGLYQGGGSIVVTRGRFERNMSNGGFGSERGGRNIVFGDGMGGAVYSRGELEIRGTSLISNEAKGGNVPPDCCSPFIGQAGSGQGGGIATEGVSRVINSTFSGNSATAGTAGGVGAFTGTAYGGGVAVSTGIVSLVNVTFGENRADATSARKAFGNSISVAAGSAACTNTIIACAAGKTNVSGVLIDGGHNICSDDSARFTLPSSLNGVDPLLGPLGDHGGATPTMSLLPASPAIDRGDDSVSPATDQRDLPRPLGGASDIGAFELAPQLALSRPTNGVIRLSYSFRAGETNQVTASTNLQDWVLLGTAVADGNGNVTFQDDSKLVLRFYKVEGSDTTQPSP